MDSEIKISVIIPAYNPGKKIIHCLNALGKNLEYFSKSFNGKIFDKLYKETIKRLDKNKKHSPCVAGSRFVEIFPDGVVRGCEVEKLWDISTIGKVEKSKDIVDILNSKKAKDF